MRWLAATIVLLVVAVSAVALIFRDGRAAEVVQRARTSIEGRATASDGTTTQTTTTPVLQAANGPLESPAPLTLKLLGTSDKISSPLKKQPRAGLLFDLDSGEVLWRHNPGRVLPIASLTKMMTALLVVESSQPGEMVPITKAALKYKGSGLGMLRPGHEVDVETMLYGLMLASGNDVAIALALHYGGGSVGGFAQKMNAKAQQLGLRCTRYKSASGFEEVKRLTDAKNVSCAQDLAVLARAVLDQPRLANVVARRLVKRTMPAVKGGKVWIYNHNPLLTVKPRYSGTIGVKTGYTAEAGHCLVAAVRRGNRRLGLVLLHSDNLNRQARSIFNAGLEAVATP